MAETVQLGPERTGKIRSFWAGFGLAVVTFGFYGLWWYYFVNDELKRVGAMHDDEKLAKLDVSLPVLAWIASVFVVIPIFISTFNYGKRIERAQEVVGIPEDRRFRPVLGYLLYFPGGLLIIPMIVWYWYATKHQNLVLENAGLENA
jgi:hypothetical protein